MNEKDYYRKLNKALICENIRLFESKSLKNYLYINIDQEKFAWLYELLDQVEKKYEFNMQKMLLPNYRKFYLWQKHFLGKVDSKRIEIAIEFIIFCCLVDKILDSRRFTNQQKNYVCEKIITRNFFSIQEYESNHFIELDILLNDIRKYIIDSKSKDEEVLKVAIGKALESEVYMYRNILGITDLMKKEDYHFLTDKSIEFEKAAFMLSTYDDNRDETNIAATNVGEIFWIIDDLCDLIEDVKCKQKNSLLFLNIEYEGNIDITQRVKLASQNIGIYISRLKYNLIQLKCNAGVDFYDYIVNEIWEWCENVRTQSQV